MAAADKDDWLELEVMRRDDHSWHPCQVSLSSLTFGGSGLIVDFENCGSEDTIYTEDEAFSRLRIRSIPLQDGECLYIKEGDRILAMHKTDLRSLFFDAEVEKIWRVPHSSRVHCRCTFSIKWLHPELKGEIMNISSSCVRKLARHGIHSHPTVAAFLNTTSPWHGSDKTPSITLLEDVDNKTGLQRLLEEQIEELSSKVADAPSKAVSDEILSGVKEVENAGHMRSKGFVASEISYLDEKTPHNQNSFRGSTRNQGEMNLEMENKDLPFLQSSAEEHFQIRSCPNPLAARAALASLMHELPQKPEISIYHVEKEGYLDTSQNTPGKHMNVISVDVTRMLVDSDICIRENLSVASNHSSAVASRPATLSPIEISNRAFGEPILESRPLVSGRRQSVANSQLEDSYETVTLEEKSLSVPEMLENGRLNTPAITTRLTRSSMARKSNNTVITAKARFSVQDMGNDIDKAKLNLSDKDGNWNGPTMPKKLTRSAILKERGHSINEVKKSSSTRDLERNSCLMMTRITRSSNQKDAGKSIDDLELEPSSKDGNLKSPTVTKRLTHLAIQKEVGMGSSIENMELNSFTLMTRITRSASQKAAGRSVNEFKESSSKDRNLDSHNTTKLTALSSQNDMGNSVCEDMPKSSIKETKFNSPSIPKRITRSSRKETGTSVEELNLELSTEDENLSRPAITRRVTRSTGHGGMGNEVNDIKLESSAKEKLSSPTIGTRITHSAIHREIGTAIDETKTDFATKEWKSCSPPTTTRITRSAVHREMGNSVDEGKLDSAAEDTKSNYLSTTRRFTRSAAQKEIGNSINEVKVDASAVGKKLNSPTITLHTRSQKEKGYSVEDVDPDSSLKEQKLNGTSISLRLTRSAAIRELENVTAIVETELKEQKLNGTPVSSRLTRSAAKRELENVTAKVETELKRGKPIQDLGTADPVEFFTPKKKRPVSSSFDADNNASQGKRKMVKVSSTIIIVHNSEGGALARNEGRISARTEDRKVKKPQLRFSQRLRFLPRTRSQRKDMSSC